jgi:predicted DCC family thiol-disulfide oxidoreductase YuxK
LSIDTPKSDSPVAKSSGSANVAATRYTPEDLPTPADRPSADVVIFDGRCVFCTGQVRNLLKLDGKGRLAFMSLHDPEVVQRFPNLTYDQMMKQMYVIDSDGNQYGGARAVRYLSRRLPKLWILAPLTHIPFTLPIQQWVYDQVAKRRYKIANKDGAECEGGTCSVHFGDKK